jgi:hypothetical protein
LQLVYGLALHKPEAIKPEMLETSLVSNDNTAAVANLVLIYQRLQSPMANDWARKLRTTAIDSGSILGWKEDWGTEITARALLAIESVDPNSPDIAKIVRYLMVKRRGSGWSSTRDTSASLLAMTGYLTRTQELTQPGAISISVNGKPRTTLPLSPNTGLGVDPTLTIPLSELKPGENTIQISRPGGVGYYAADMRQVVSMDEMGAMSSENSLSISRAYYKLDRSRLENGVLSVLPGERKIQEAQAGELLKVIVTVRTDIPRQFVIIEDPIPSNCRVNERGEVDSYEDWSSWWAQTIVRDDRVAFFVTDLPAGEHKFSYVMRAENEGVGRALPTLIYNMYDPDLRASTASSSFTVVPK